MKYTTHTRVTISIPHEDAMKLVRSGVGQTDERQWAGNHSTADLLDALDAVPVAEANQSIEHELAQRDEAVRLSHEYRNRAEKAEALVGVERAFKEKAVTRAEEAEAEALEQAKLVRTWADRAEKAEALVARVQRLRDVSGDTVGVEELDAILDPKPAFTLPTEAGAGITAHASDWTTTPIELRLFSDGLWHAQNGKGYTPKQVLDRFTGHRLLGADR